MHQKESIFFNHGIASSLCMICWTWVISFLPNFPAGCELAKSFFVKPLDSKSAIANASPKARAAVVDDVGARSSGHASLLIFKTY